MPHCGPQRTLTLQILTAGHEGDRPLFGLRKAFLGGDFLRPDQARDLKRFAPNVEITNFYGSTETPQAAGYHRWDGDTSRMTLPIGKGSSGFQLGVLSADNTLCGPGEQGQVAVRSRYLSLGYVEDGEISTPGDRCDDARGERTIYRTGDYGYFLEDGSVALIGRQDDQIKIRGYRVDLAEVSAALLAIPGVKSAVAVTTSAETGEQIVAFASGAATLNDKEMVAALAGQLPAYMVPARLQILDTLPLLPNGKIDGEALEAMAAGGLSTKTGTNPPRTAEERALVESWSSLLGREIVSRDASFAELGGDSLSYVQVYLATEDRLGTMPDQWQFLSIAEPARLGTNTRPSWISMDTSMLIRAISIVVVVCGHLHLLNYDGGATSALFVISGYLFGGFQLNETFLRQSVRPIARVFLKVLVPTVIFSLIFYVPKVILEKPVHISTVLFYSNFISMHEVGNDFFIWYVQCMLQIILITGVLYFICRAIVPKMTAFRFAYFAMGLALVAKIVSLIMLHADWRAAHLDTPQGPAALSRGVLTWYLWQLFWTRAVAFTQRWSRPRPLDEDLATV